MEKGEETLITKMGKKGFQGVVLNCKTGKTSGDQ